VDWWIAQRMWLGSYYVQFSRSLTVWGSNYGLSGIMGEMCQLVKSLLTSTRYQRVSYCQDFSHLRSLQVMGNCTSLIFQDLFWGWVRPIGLWMVWEPCSLDCWTISPVVVHPFGHNATWEGHIKESHIAGIFLTCEVYKAWISLLFQAVFW
jgi:hypothetical protein